MIRFLVVAGIVAAIFALGWKEPLRYRFLSPQEIEAIEHPARPTPQATPQATPKSTAWMWDNSRKTGLDREAHDAHYGVSRAPTLFAWPTPTPR